MAYDVNKLVKLSALQSLAQRVKTACASKEEMSAVNKKLNEMSSSGAAGGIKGVKINGQTSPNSNGEADITIKTGTGRGNILVNNQEVTVNGLKQLAFKDQVSKNELDSDLASTLNQMAQKGTTLSSYGIKDAYTKDEINTKLSSVYVARGTKAYTELGRPAREDIGSVYNISGYFITDDRFIEGSGKLYPEGTNIVVVDTGTEIKFDVLYGIINFAKYALKTDLENKVDKVSGKGLSQCDFTTEEKQKLGGIAAGAVKVEKSSINGNIKINGLEVEVFKVDPAVASLETATDGEVTSMLGEVFGATA